MIRRSLLRFLPLLLLFASSPIVVGCPPDTPDDDATGDDDDSGGLFVEVSAGATHSCGRLDYGTVLCWGNDGAGQSSPPDPPGAP